MAGFKEHCEDCVKEIGKPYEEVHIWLDGLFRELGPKHRSARHHAGGVEKIREMYGDEAAKAAEIHIRKDWNGGIPTESQAQMWTIFGPSSTTGETFLTDNLCEE